MKIYLAHPGENDGRFLTERGIWQTKTLARRLSTDGVKFGRVYANGHNVSKQTADIISKYVGTPIIHDERFLEIPKEVIEGAYDEMQMENLDYINLFVSEVIDRGEDALIVIGEGVHRAVISRLTGMPLASTRHFSLSNGSLSVIRHHSSDNSGVWRISSVNDITHLNVP